MVTSQGGQAANAGDSGLVVQIPEGYKATIIDDPGAGASGNMISIYTEKEKVFWAKFREYGNQALLDGFIRKLDQMRDFTKEE